MRDVSGICSVVPVLLHPWNSLLIYSEAIRECCNCNKLNPNRWNFATGVFFFFCQFSLTGFRVANVSSLYNKVGRSHKWQGHLLHG